MGLIFTGGLVITMISDGIAEMIMVPFTWTYDNIIHPIFAFFGIIVSFIWYVLRGGGDPGEFGNIIRDRFGVEIFHGRPDPNNLPDRIPTDIPDVQEINLNDDRTASNTAANSRPSSSSASQLQEPSEGVKMLGPKDKGKTVVWEEPQIYDKNQPTNTIMPQFVTKTTETLTVETSQSVDPSSVTIDKQNSPILSQLNTENVFNTSADVAATATTTATACASKSWSSNIFIGFKSRIYCFGTKFWFGIEF
jgi:hypothetical protein